MARQQLSLVIAATLASIATAHACEVSFDCAHGRASINGKHYPIVCASHTARGVDGGTLSGVFKANGRWRPGLVAPGTPMITTTPRLCYDCHIHVTGDFRHSNGCVGTTAAAFAALSACAGSKFSIASK